MPAEYVELYNSRLGLEEKKLQQLSLRLDILQTEIALLLHEVEQSKRVQQPKEVRWTPDTVFNRPHAEEHHRPRAEEHLGDGDGDVIHL